MNGPNWIVMIVGETGLNFRVADADGETVLTGNEPYDGTSKGAIARASIRATATATRWAAHNGGIEGLEIIGQ